MEKPITLSYRWTLKEQLRANHHATRLTATAHWTMIAVKVVGVLFSLAGIVRLYQGREERRGSISLVVLGILFFGMPYLQRLAVRLKYRRMPLREKRVHWQISAEGIDVTTELSNAHFTWEALVKVVRVTDGFLLATHPSVFQWLPADGFQDSADVERFAELAKAKARQYDDRS